MRGLASGVVSLPLPHNEMKFPHHLLAGAGKEEEHTWTQPAEITSATRQVHSIAHEPKGLRFLMERGPGGVLSPRAKSQVMQMVERTTAREAPTEPQPVASLIDAMKAAEMY